MPTSKKRNHFIPRALLNRFASRADLNRKKYWIWTYQKNASPKEISTRDVALGAYFYGRENSRLEDQLSKIEGELGSSLAKIDRGEPVSNFNRFLSDYAWLQSIRTRSFRDRITRTLRELLLRSAKHTGTEEARAGLLRRSEIMLAERFAELSPEQIAIARLNLGGI